MGYPGELGLIVPGAFADKLIIDGNPLENVSLPHDHSKLQAIEKDGVCYKNALQLAKTQVAVRVKPIAGPRMRGGVTAGVRERSARYHAPRIARAARAFNA